MRTHMGFVVVDAFVTDEPFSGNPAGVVVADDFPEDSWMQAVADELHQAETSFVVPQEPGSFDLRWFTPVAEVALCGHATLATAHWLWKTGVAVDDEIRFTTRSGVLTASRAGDSILLDFPAVPAAACDEPPSLARSLAGVRALWVGLTQHENQGEQNVLVVLDDERSVRELRPDLRAVEELPAGGLIVTAPGDRGDVVTRYFAPLYGIPEDPVTGSAHCTVGPYWAAKMGPCVLARQLSRRGGTMEVTTTDSGRVLLAGKARLCLSGTVVGSD